MNRGIWKVWETKIRNESQTDSLLIICGGKWNCENPTLVNNMNIPNLCWKVVYSLKTKTILYCLLFTNSSQATVEEIKLEVLETVLGYKLNLAF